jgi:hypothetical protein
MAYMEPHHPNSPSLLHPPGSFTPSFPPLWLCAGVVFVGMCGCMPCVRGCGMGGCGSTCVRARLCAGVLPVCMYACVRVHVCLCVSVSVGGSACAACQEECVPVHLRVSSPSHCPHARVDVQQDSLPACCALHVGHTVHPVRPADSTPQHNANLFS